MFFFFLFQKEINLASAITDLNAAAPTSNGGGKYALTTTASAPQAATNGSYVDEDIDELTSTIPPPMNVIKADNSEQQVSTNDAH